MADASEETPVSYEDLRDLLQDFEDAETEIIRQQYKLTKPIYERREKLVAQIPNFWRLVVDQAPPDIDQYVQPTDSTLLLNHLETVSVRRFEIEDAAAEDGDPRSFSIQFEFADNPYFENKVLEKKFWFRRADDGWEGLVSEPVDISWKKGKDLTDGLLHLTCAAWQSCPLETLDDTSVRKPRDPNDEEKTLMDKILHTPVPSLSFFAWFGFVGRRVTASESRKAKSSHTKRRQLKREAKEVPAELEDKEGLDGAEDLDTELEIFPDGATLALAVAEELWPDALRLFTQAHEMAEMSDSEFESDDDEEHDSSEPEAKDEPPAKKRKA